MIESGGSQEAQFRTVTIIAVAALIVAPLLYLIMAYLVTVPSRGDGEQQMLIYILLIVGTVQPVLLPVIEKSQVNSYRKNIDSSMTPSNLFTTLSIIKYAFIEAIYLYGLAVYFLSGELNSMLYFYPVGIIWTFIHWPRKSTFEKFFQKVGKSEPLVPAG